MATVSKGYTFGSTEQVTHTKLHTLLDSAAVTDIVNADVASAAEILGTKFDLTEVGTIGSAQASAAKFTTITATGSQQFGGGDWTWNEEGASGLSARWEGGSEPNLMTIETDTDTVLWGASAIHSASGVAVAYGILGIGHTATASAGEFRIYEGSNYAGFSISSALNTTYTHQFPSASALAGQVLVSDGASAFIWGNGGVEYASGDYVICESNSEEDTGDSSYVKTKEVIMDKGGSVHVGFEVQGGFAKDASAKIYINGEDWGGIVTHTPDNTWETHSEVVSGLAVGDLLQVYGKCEATGGGVRNLKLKADCAGHPCPHDTYD